MRFKSYFSPLTKVAAVRSISGCDREKLLLLMMNIYEKNKYFRKIFNVVHSRALWKPPVFHSGLFRSDCVCSWVSGKQNMTMMIMNAHL